MYEATRTEINDLAFTPTVGFHEYILWLKIAVDEFKTVDEFQSLQYLPGESLESPNCEVPSLLILPVVLVELIQVILEELSD